jgi:hypothetical protein
VVRPLPILIVVVASLPAWIAWPFLPADRQGIVLDMVHQLSQWTHGPVSG